MSKKSKNGRAGEEAAAGEIGGETLLPGRGAVPKRRAKRHATPKSTGRGTLGKAMLVAVVLCLTASGLTLAGLGRIGGSYTAAPLGSGSPTASAPLTPAPVNFSPTSPSKEYIYAGGRLVATEEPAGLNPPGGLKFIQTKSTVSCGGKGTVWGYLTWNDGSADETEFVIEERLMKTGLWSSWTALATVGQNVTTYDLVLSQPLVEYRVKAVNASASSPYSNVVRVIAVPMCETTSCPASAPFIISEFRLRGAAGPKDEFIELYNNSDSPLTVCIADTSGGWTLAARTASGSSTVLPRRSSIYT